MIAGLTDAVPDLATQRRDRGASPWGERVLGWLSRWPLRWRRGVLVSVFMFAGWLPWFRPDVVDASYMNRALNLPLRRVLRLARRAVFHDLMFALEWLALGRRSKAGLLADAKAVTVAGEDLLAWAATQPAVILATVHSASYATSLAKLLHDHFQGRRIIIAKSNAITPVERDALAKLALIGVAAEFMFLDRPDTFVALARRLRAGAVLITLIDLPERYGRAERVELLWRPARMTVGAADLSALCRAPIVLFRTVSGTTGDRILVDRVMDVGPMDRNRRAVVADELARFVNRAILDHPEQWHMWGRLGEYYGADRAD